MEELWPDPQSHPGSVRAGVVRPERYDVRPVPKHTSPPCGSVCLLEGKDVVLCHEMHGVLALDLMLLIPAGEESLGIPGAGTERFRVRDCRAECHVWH